MQTISLPSKDYVIVTQLTEFNKHVFTTKYYTINL